MRIIFSKIYEATQTQKNVIRVDRILLFSTFFFMFGFDLIVSVSQRHVHTINDSQWNAIIITINALNRINVVFVLIQKISL